MRLIERCRERIFLQDADGWSIQTKRFLWCQGTPERWICGGEIVDFDAARGMVKIAGDS